MVTNICVLRSGGDYTPRHVQMLAKQVKNLVCMSDVDVEGVKTIPLQTDWPGWWAKVEICRPDIKGDVMFFDLDTVVFDVPKVTGTTVLRDFTRPEQMGSGLMYITAEDRAKCWDAFKPEQINFGKWKKYGDQAFFDEIIGDSQKWQDIYPVYSYKESCNNGLPNNAMVVCFHGKPRPWEAKDKWLQQVYKEDRQLEFKDLVLKYEGKKICVMGGADSLADDLEKVDADVYISANEHGLIREVDYIVAMDEKHGGNHHGMVKYLKSLSDKPIVGPEVGCDIQLPTWPDYPKRTYSGMVAAWLAWVMGAKVVILAGMDGYNGQGKAMRQAKALQEVVKTHVRAVSGPLQDVFGAYRKSERFPAYKPHSSIETLISTDGQIQIEVKKPTQISGRDVHKGEKHTVMRHEVMTLLKHKMVCEI